MNVIVANKQKNALDNANIETIKELTGLFEIDDVINNLKGYFFSKLIIDATSIVDFAKETVLKKLVDGIGAEKIYLLLPPKPEPPKKFCDFLVSLGIYNFSANIEEFLNFLQNPNTQGNVNNYENDFYNNNLNDNVKNVNINNSINESLNAETVEDVNRDNRIIIGFKNVTKSAGSTTLIYMLKKQLEQKYKMNVSAFEFGKGDFRYFNSPNMLDINPNNIELSINNCNDNIILLDLDNDNFDSYCDDIIYLIEPSIIKINKLLFERNDIFSILNNKKVVLNKCILSPDDVNIFAKEAGIKIYFNIPYINDRVDNYILDEFIKKLGIINKY